MSNRFHNKWHRHNHHTDKNPGEPDAGWDPIASPEDPFRGPFIIDSPTMSLSANGPIELQVLRALSPGGLPIRDSADTTHATVASTGIALDQLTASRPLWLDADNRVTSPPVATFRGDIGAAADADVVKLTGNQTVEGAKTFINVLTGPTIQSGDMSGGSGTVIGDLVNNAASGQYAVAEGSSTVASGDASHAEGLSTAASGNYSHAEGKGTAASGDCSHAEGENTTALGRASHVEGRSSFALGDFSSATGRRANAFHDGARVEADGQDEDVGSTAANQYTARFAAGYRFFGGALYMNIVQALTTSGIAVQDSAGTTHTTVTSAGIALDQLTASRPLALDASNNVISPPAADFRETIGAGFVDYILGHYPKPAASALDWLLLNRAIRIPSTSPGVAFCQTAAAAGTTFNIRKNGSNIGTVVFAAAGTVGTVTVTSNTDFAAGDRLELLAPASPDADLSDMQLSLKGIIL